MSEDLSKLYKLLTPRERKLGACVVVAMVVAAGLQALTAASLYPFLSVVSDSSALNSGRIGWFYNEFGFSSESQFLTISGLAVLALVVLANGVLAFSHWARLRFQWGVNHSLALRLLKSYLGRRYAYFLNENTAGLNKNILSEAQQITGGLLSPVLRMLSSATLAGAMIILLFFVDPVATLVVLAITGGGYLAAYLFIRRRLKVLGSTYAEANRERYKTTAEAFGGIKDVKVLGREGYFVDAFRPISRTFTRSLAARNVYASMPKYVIEALAMGSLLAVLVLLLMTSRPVSLIVPIMGTFTFAGYRMMPAFRDILSAMSSFRFTEDIFQSIEEALEAEKKTDTGLEPVESSLEFKREVAFRDVTYRYPGADRAALRNVSLTVPRNSTVAIAGRTGAGKTTLVDLFLGLLLPTEGTVQVDDVPLTAENVHQWRTYVGYVPQDIYLADTSVKRNIAYGVSEEGIKDRRVVQVARIAHIHDFITEELSNGYDSLSGERGVRLSGGQRQRIGIARALYHDPSVLVLDEATSEIDGATEAKILKATREQLGEKTLVVIAHGLETIRFCDCIYLIDDGKVVTRGTYEELMRTSPLFQNLARVRTASTQSV